VGALAVVPGLPIWWWAGWLGVFAVVSFVAVVWWLIREALTEDATPAPHAGNAGDVSRH
jgi:hypothetical protein